MVARTRLLVMLYTCFAQRSKTLFGPKKQPQRVLALEKQPQREVSWKLTVHKFSNVLIKKRVT